MGRGCARPGAVRGPRPAHSVSRLVGGAHATLEQSALHQTAVENGQHHHHGAAEHRERNLGDGGGKTGTWLSGVAHGPEFTPAAPYAAFFQDLLQATLTVPSEALVPDAPPRHASPAEAISSQHSSPVPHRPPILLLSTFAIPNQ